MTMQTAPMLNKVIKHAVTSGLCISDEDEEKKPSRSARRKALKRKCRRLGLTPPQAPAASSAPAASVSPALAAAAAASPSDPNAGLDQPPNKKQKTQPFTVQPVISQPMKSHTAGDGHVYFAGSSSSESDSDSGACLQQLEQASGRADKPPTRWSQPNQALGKGKEDEAPSAAAAAAAAAKCQGMQVHCSALAMCKDLNCIMQFCMMTTDMRPHSTPESHTVLTLQSACCENTGYVLAFLCTATAVTVYALFCSAVCTMVHNNKTTL